MWNEFETDRPTTNQSILTLWTGRVGDVKTRPTPTGYLIFSLMRFDVYLLLRSAQNWSTQKISRNFYEQNFLLNFRIFRRFAKNCESEANSLRFASQKIIWRSLRFRFAIFFEKKFAFASLSQSIFCQNLDPCADKDAISGAAHVIPMLHIWRIGLRAKRSDLTAL